MAYICTKPKGSCSSCSHFRYDEDYDDNACFASYDEKKAKAETKHPRYDYPSKDNKGNS